MNLINQINFGNNFMRPIDPSFKPKGMFYIKKKKCKLSYANIVQVVIF